MRVLVVEYKKMNTGRINISTMSEETDCGLILSVLSNVKWCDIYSIRAIRYSYCPINTDMDGLWLSECLKYCRRSVDLYFEKVKIAVVELVLRWSRARLE